MYILLVGLNHKTAPLHVRERFSLSAKQKQDLYRSFREGSVLESLVILSTCNRTELYAVTREKEAGQKDLYALLSRHAGDRAEFSPFLYAKDCEEAVLHLYQVASGLDSMVLGETQILGQLKAAYAEAKDQGASERVMNQLMQKAFAVGKKVRTQTGIDQHPLSVSYIAVEQAKKQGGLTGKKVLIVGAGEAGQLIARYLKEERLEAIFISNRSADVAQRLAEELEGKAVRFEALPRYLEEVDFVISCTGANHLVVHGKACEQALHRRGGKPLVFIDIAVPRDVDPAFAQISGVQLWDMDRLQKVVGEQQQQREQAAQKGQAVIQEEMVAFQAWSAAWHVTPVVAALKQRGEEVRKRELERAFRRLEESLLSEREKKIITEMGQAIVNQLLRPPVENLKRLAEQGQGESYAAYAKKLFHWPPEGEEE